MAKFDKSAYAFLAAAWLVALALPHCRGNEENEEDKGGGGGSQGDGSDDDSNGRESEEEGGVDQGSGSSRSLCVPDGFPCPRACSEDDECEEHDGEVCCDFYGRGKACVPASSCPVTCDRDRDCETEEGEVCCDIGERDRVCAGARDCPTLCDRDRDCETEEGEVCCDFYSEAVEVCVDTSACPAGCDNNRDCDDGEACCRTENGRFCLDEDSCPAECDNNRDCADKGEDLVCCEGFCQDGCVRECESPRDCDTREGEFCCETAGLLVDLLSGGLPGRGGEGEGEGEGWCGEGDCCRFDDPCDWAADGFCDCDGRCPWDGFDCSGEGEGESEAEGEGVRPAFCGPRCEDDDCLDGAICALATKGASPTHCVIMCSGAADCPGRGCYECVPAEGGSVCLPAADAEPGCLGSGGGDWEICGDTEPCLGDADCLEVIFP